MPIVPVEPPNGLVQKAADQIRALPKEGDQFLGNLSMKGDELVAPHQVYVLPFDAIRQRNLSQAVPVGWRWLIVSQDVVVGSVEADDEGKSVSVDASPYGQATATALDKIDGLPELEGGNFELRLLRVNALYMVAAWLVGPQQMLVPLAPSPPLVDSGRAYTESGFLDVLGHPGVSAVRGWAPDRAVAD